MFRNKRVRWFDSQSYKVFLFVRTITHECLGIDLYSHGLVLLKFLIQKIFIKLALGLCRVRRPRQLLPLQCLPSIQHSTIGTDNIKASVLCRRAADLIDDSF